MESTRLIARWQRTTILLTVVPLILFAALGRDGSSRPWVLAACLVIGSSTHVAATGWFLFEPDVRSMARRRWMRFVVVPVVLVVASAWMGANAPTRTIDLVLCGFFSWQFFHFQKQNLGIAALMASSSGSPSLSTRERRCVVLSGVAGIFGLLGHPSLLQLPLHSAIPALFEVGAVLFVVCLVGGIVTLYRRNTSERPRIFVITYVAVLMFNVPIFLFSSPYAAVGGMTVAHGFQYLFMVGSVVGVSVRQRRRWERATVLSNVLIFGTATLAIAVHLHDGDTLEKAVYGAAIGVTMAHFVIDGALWRLREPRARRFMATRLPHLVSLPPDVLVTTSPTDIG